MPQSLSRHHPGKSIQRFALPDQLHTSQNYLLSLFNHLDTILISDSASARYPDEHQDKSLPTASTFEFLRPPPPSSPPAPHDSAYRLSTVAPARPRTPPDQTPRRLAPLPSPSANPCRKRQFLHNPSIRLTNNWVRSFILPRPALSVAQIPSHTANDLVAPAILSPVRSPTQGGIVFEAPNARHRPHARTIPPDLRRRRRNRSGLSAGP